MDEILGLQLFKVSPVWIIVMPVMSLGKVVSYFRMDLKGSFIYWVHKNFNSVTRGLKFSSSCKS